MQQHLDVTDDEAAALLRLLRHALDTDPYPQSPRLYPPGRSWKAGVSRRLNELMRLIKHDKLGEIR